MLSVNLHLTPIFATCVFDAQLDTSRDDMSPGQGCKEQGPPGPPVQGSKLSHGEAMVKGKKSYIYFPLL